LTWEQYPQAALGRGLRDGFSHPREAARRVKALLNNRGRFIQQVVGGTASHGGTASRSALQLQLTLTPPRDLLGIVFPVIAYGLGEPAFRALARAAVQGPDDPNGLRLAFLRAWGLYGDPNFEAAARKLGLSFEGVTP
jgi:hypothetical protein